MSAEMYKHDYECLKQAFKDLMLKYIKVSMSSDNPIFADPLTLDNTNEDTCYKLRVSEILDEMNKEDWNNDDLYCRLVMEPTWAPRGISITTECVSDNEDEQSDTDEDETPLTYEVRTEEGVCKYLGENLIEAEKHYKGLVSEGIKVFQDGILIYYDNNFDDYEIYDGRSY